MEVVVVLGLGPVILGLMIIYGVDTKRYPQTNRVPLESLSWI